MMTKIKKNFINFFWFYVFLCKEEQEQLNFQLYKHAIYKTQVRYHEEKIRITSQTP